MNKAPERTFSVCPVCRRRIPAERIRVGGEVHMVKRCTEHGEFRTPLWRGAVPWEEWRGEIPPPGEEECLHCGDCRGLCRDHQRKTCCTLLEVTNRCNMNCRFCFAGDSREEDPPLEQVKAWVFDLTEPGKTFLQLSGGEPTLRDDLPEIVAFAGKCGCRYIQLNTNGIRLAEDEDYVRRLAEAGLSFVFLQFDGVTDDIYEVLRNRPMLGIKERAIENCGRYGIGVTLVPVIVPGVNESRIGDIIRYGIGLSPVVRGVHFQPVSYFGRIPNPPEERDRYTLDQLIAAIVSQSGGQIAGENLVPSCCDHPMCGFHGDFVVLPDRSLMALTSKRNRSCCGGPEDAVFDPAERNREFIGRRWRSGSGGDAREEPDGILPQAGSAEAGAALPDLSDMDVFLERVKQYGFTLTAMDFQDAGNLDFERLRRCSLHVYRRGRWIPFCACYLTKWA